MPPRDRLAAAAGARRAVRARQAPAVKTAAAPAAARFEALWGRCVSSPPSPDAKTVYAHLYGLFSAPFRRYHTLDHILDCLRRADEVTDLLADPDAVELALWFHDAVYELDAPSNERASADLFISFAQGARPAFRRRVCGLIMATQHEGRERDNDRRFIVDIDLAGFGAPWSEFMRNGALVREESPGKTDAQYHAGQIFFLRRLQRRRNFFCTDYFRGRYEAKARDNLRRLLSDLAAKGYANHSHKPAG
jgi:predicted metal-dependent HD superfamily phosphohydrolase